MNTQDIRNLFLNYFVKNNHTLVESSSLIPQGDDSLLFTNSGMVQFKNIFVGLEKPQFKLATSVQKCLRAGGKHNDLDNVGYTPRHHTFFEMLGNFSFGDYFKEQAIYYAWDLLTKELGISKDKLVITIYHTDDEAYNFWKKIAMLEDSKIIKINNKDNFWEMGDSGPCGPCSEIFYDYGANISGGLPGSANQDGNRFVEIWNLVFMQYEKLKNGELINLSTPCIDTGMGLERISCVLQNKLNNYDTNVFTQLIEHQSEILNTKITIQNRSSFNILADHIRACAFMIADGILPSNEGRGYILRRILRRAIRHSHLLGVSEPVMYKFVQPLKNIMSKAYPQLALKEAFIIDTIKQEELKFCNTFDNGIKLLNDEIKKLKNNNILSGTTAFKLYETYGFPLDLTQDIVKKHNLSVNQLEFDEAFEKHKNLAKQSWKMQDNTDNNFWIQLQSNLPQTQFIGYDTLLSTSTILAIVEYKDGSLHKVDKSSQREFFIVLNKTPMFAQMGGQIADKGVISKDNFFAKVIDVQKKSQELFVHHILLEDYEANNYFLQTNDTIAVSVDNILREKISANHSATHLLHSSLKKHLGQHISQRGSQLDSKYIRFDISHNSIISDEEIQHIENDINAIILQNLPITTTLMETNKAIAMGALALFSEKYPQIARVVSIGNSNNTLHSIELCGGTHCTTTSQIGLFKIISQSSIGSGVRRIEAICGLEAIQYLTNYMQQHKKISQLLNVEEANIQSKLQDTLTENKALKKDLENITYKYNLAILEKSLIKENSNYYLCQEVEYMNIPNLKDVSNALLKKYPNLVSLVFSLTENNKASFVLTSNINNYESNLKNILNTITTHINGSGGGSKNIYQGNGLYSNLISLKQSFFSIIKNS